MWFLSWKVCNPRQWFENFVYHDSAVIVYSLIKKHNFNINGKNQPHTLSGQPFIGDHPKSRNSSKSLYECSLCTDLGFSNTETDALCSTLYSSLSRHHCYCILLHLLSSQVSLQEEEPIPPYRHPEYFTTCSHLVTTFAEILEECFAWVEVSLRNNNIGIG